MLEGMAMQFGGKPVYVPVQLEWSDDQFHECFEQESQIWLFKYYFDYNLVKS